MHIFSNLQSNFNAFILFWLFTVLTNSITEPSNSIYFVLFVCLFVLDILISLLFNHFIHIVTNERMNGE